MKPALGCVHHPGRGPAAAVLDPSTTEAGELRATRQRDTVSWRWCIGTSSRSQPFTSARSWNARRYSRRTRTDESPEAGASKRNLDTSVACAAMRLSDSRRVGTQVAAVGASPVQRFSRTFA